MLLGGLPRKENMKLYNIHYIASSNQVRFRSHQIKILHTHPLLQVAALEFLEPIVEDLLKLESGIAMYDVFLQKEVLVIAPVLCLLCDNPRASEVTNHMGSAANRYCRLCLVY